MKTLLIIGNTGLNRKNNLTSIRMNETFRVLSKDHSIRYYPMKAIEAFDYLIPIRKEAEGRVWIVFFECLKDVVFSRPDLIIAETFKAAIVARIISMITGVKFVWRQFGSTFHDELVGYNGPDMKALIKKVAHQWIGRCSKCKAVIVTEDGCRNRTLFKEMLGIESEKIFIIKNQRPEHLIYHREFIEREELKLVHVGRIARWKKTHLVIKALAEVFDKKPDYRANIRLTIIGASNDESYEEEIKDLIITCKLSSNVRIVKNLELDGIIGEMESADILVSLTAYNPIIEALSIGVPAVTYEYGEVSEAFDGISGVYVLCSDYRKSSGLTLNEENKLQNELTEFIVDSYSNRKKLFDDGRCGQFQMESKFPDLEMYVSCLKRIIDSAMD